MLASMLTACATPTVMSEPIVRDGADRAINRDFVSAESHVQKNFPNNKAMVYHQESGGGGVAVGVLLGPIGTAANIAMINSRTNGDMEKIGGKYDYDVFGNFEKIARQQSSLGEAITKGKTVGLAPRLVFVKNDDDDNVMMGCTLIVDQRELDAAAGFDNYIVQTTVKLPFDEFVQGVSETRKSEMDNSAHACLEEVAKLYLNDIGGKYLPDEKSPSFALSSKYLTPRITIPLWVKSVSSDEEKVILRTTFALMELPKKEINLAPN